MMAKKKAMSEQEVAESQKKYFKTYLGMNRLLPAYINLRKPSCLGEREKKGIKPKALPKTPRRVKESKPLQAPGLKQPSDLQAKRYNPKDVTAPSQKGLKQGEFVDKMQEKFQRGVIEQIPRGLFNKPKSSLPPLNSPQAVVPQTRVPHEVINSSLTTQNTTKVFGEAFNTPPSSFPPAVSYTHLTLPTKRIV